MQESALHAALKSMYTHTGDQQEALVGGYIVDVVRGDVLIEIQTRSFNKIKNKLQALLDRHRIHLIYPVAEEKWIVKYSSPTRTSFSRRKSPRRGRVEDIFYEIKSIPELIAHPNLVIEILMIREEEIRQADGRGSWRRRGVSIVDRRLVDILSRTTLDSPADYHRFLPAALPNLFTSRDLANASGLSLPLANKMTYCLRYLGVIRQIGKQGKSFLYEQNVNPKADSTQFAEMR